MGYNHEDVDTGQEGTGDYVSIHRTPIDIDSQAYKIAQFMNLSHERDVIYALQNAQADVALADDPQTEKTEKLAVLSGVFHDNYQRLEVKPLDYDPNMHGALDTYIQDVLTKFLDGQTLLEDKKTHSMQFTERNKLTLPLQIQQGDAVLVINDDPAIRMAMTQNLEKRFGDGITIETASNAQEALLALQNKKYAVAICDNQMPGEAGEIESNAGVMLAMTAHMDGIPTPFLMASGASLSCLQRMRLIEETQVVGFTDPYNFMENLAGVDAKISASITR